MKKPTFAIILLSTSLYAIPIPSGDCMEGDCQNGKGVSKIITELDGEKSEVVYRGSFKNGLFHGFGTLTVGAGKMEALFQNGELIEGKEWQNEELTFEGTWYPTHTWKQGKFYYKNDRGEKCIFEGAFNENNQKSGKGTVTCNGRIVYGGNWKDGQKDFTVTPDFIKRTKKIKEKWIDGKISTDIKIREMLLDFPADLNFYDAEGISDTPDAEVLFYVWINTAECCGLNAIILTDQINGKTIEDLLSERDPAIHIEGVVIAASGSGMDSETFEPVIRVDSISPVKK